MTAGHLLQHAKEGSRSSLGRLLDRYAGYLTLLARAQIGAHLRGKVDPGDVVQETFLEAHRQFPQFRGQSEPELLGWLRRILAGQLALAARRFLGTKGRDARLERELVVRVDQSSQALERGLTAPGSSPSHAAARREQSVLLSQALERLPVDYREVIILRHLENLPFAETAARMGRSEDSVQKLWVRALARLRKELGGAEGAER
ncbi:MAG TPA: sigma-70 family RNA polymerase sigma factor [Phycisphaerae bacterium]|nr:sigma-70 family RNA polymerase sigma factor [Phycisphaerae bacterium]